jgi:hypothetical protein
LVSFAVSRQRLQHLVRLPAATGLVATLPSALLAFGCAWFAAFFNLRQPLRTFF